MDTQNAILHTRIKELCEENNITIKSIEQRFGLGSSSISKWKHSYPSADKIRDIAEFFGVSIDYLMGSSDIRSQADQVIGDDAVVTLQRAFQKMSDADKEKSIQMLKIGFDYAFSDEGDE